MDINAASRDDLLSLLGIGEELADAIMLRRPFNAIEDLLKIPGIGPASLQRLREQGVTVGTVRIQQEEDTSAIIEAVFGPLERELRKQVLDLKAYEPRIVEWLQASPKRVEDFTEDPIATLRAAFPALELQKNLTVESRTLPDYVQVGIQERYPIDLSANNLFLNVWEHVSESEANTQAFKLAPFAVIASIGSGYPTRSVAVVKRAFEAAFAINSKMGSQIQLVSQRRSGGRDLGDALALLSVLRSRTEVSIPGGEPDASR